MNRIVQVGLMILSILILLGSAVVYFGASRANKMIDEANTAVEAGNAAATLGGKEYGELFTEAHFAGFPQNRAELAPTAKNLADHMEQAASNYDKAAEKFEEACKQNVGKIVVEYWKAKLDGFRKLAQSKRAFRSVALLITDESVSTIEIMNEKLTPLIDQAMKLDAEAKAFAAQAEALREKNKDSFQ